MFVYSLRGNDTLLSTILLVCNIVHLEFDRIRPLWTTCDRVRIWGDVSHSTEVVWEMITQEEWLGCWHDASPMFDIPGSTPVWAQYIYFLDF